VFESAQNKGKSSPCLDPLLNSSRSSEAGDELCGWARYKGAGDLLGSILRASRHAPLLVGALHR